MTRLELLAFWLVSAAAAVVCAMDLFVWRP